jgi:hypothetical protein
MIARVEQDALVSAWIIDDASAEFPAPGAIHNERAHRVGPVIHTDGRSHRVTIAVKFIQTTGFLVVRQLIRTQSYPQPQNISEENVKSLAFVRPANNVFPNTNNIKERT